MKKHMSDLLMIIFRLILLFLLKHFLDVSLDSSFLEFLVFLPADSNGYHLKDLLRI